MENTNKRREITHQKKQEINLLSINPEEDNHTNIKITSEITGSYLASGHRARTQAQQAARVKCVVRDIA